MNNDNIEQLYKLVFSPLITPYNLLENAKLDNYEYVNYSTENNKFIVEMKCTMEDNSKAVFTYFFDKNDNLQKAIMLSNGIHETIFDRNEEMEKIKGRILNQRRNNTKSIAN